MFSIQVSSKHVWYTKFHIKEHGNVGSMWNLSQTYGFYFIYKTGVNLSCDHRGVGRSGGKKVHQSVARLVAVLWIKGWLCFTWLRRVQTESWTVRCLWRDVGRGNNSLFTTNIHVCSQSTVSSRSHFPLWREILLGFSIKLSCHLSVLSMFHSLNGFNSVVA